MMTKVPCNAVASQCNVKHALSLCGYRSSSASWLLSIWFWPQSSFIIANSFAGRCTSFKSTSHSRKLPFSLNKLKRQMPDGSITYWHRLMLQENQSVASGGTDLSILWETFGVGVAGLQQLSGGSLPFEKKRLQLPLACPVLDISSYTIGQDNLAPSPTNGPQSLNTPLTNARN